MGRRAALLGEADGHAEDIANTINFARLAVEAAALDTLRIVQRALGMGAFRRGTRLNCCSGIWPCTSASPRRTRH